MSRHGHHGYLDVKRPARVGRGGLPFDPIAEARRQWAAHGWDDVADGMAALTSVMRAQQLLLARCDEVLADFDLTFARYELLALLAFTRHGELPLGKAGDRLQVHPASVTNAVDRLVDAGLVERVPHPTDGRGALARITDDGRRVAAEATARLNAEVFADLGLSATEARRLALLGDAGQRPPPVGRVRKLLHEPGVDEAVDGVGDARRVVPAGAGLAERQLAVAGEGQQGEQLEPGEGQAGLGQDRVAEPKAVAVGIRSPSPSHPDQALNRRRVAVGNPIAIALRIRT